MATPNLGLTIPVGGTTPGASNNTTAGTYPYEMAANLNNIDSLTYSANNPVPTAGMNINGNLSMNGFSLTDALNLGTSTLTATGNLSLTGSTPTISTSDSFFTLSSNAAATGSTGIVLNNLITMTGGTLVSITNNGTQKAKFDYAGNLTCNAVTGSGNLSMTGSASFTSLAATSAVFTGGIGVTGASTFNSTLGVVGTISCAAVNGGAFSGSAFTGGSGAACQINGYVAATSAIANIIDNHTTQTSGTVVSFRTGGGEVASLDFQGNLNLGTLTGTAALTPILNLNAGTGSAAVKSTIQGTSTGMVLNVPTSTTHSLQVAASTVVSVASTGLTTSGLTATGASSLALSATLKAHIVAGGSAPTVGSFHVDFGTVTGSGITGGDLGGIVTFTTGTASGTIAAGSALFTVTLATGYSSTAYAIFASLAQTAGALDVTSFYGVPVNTNSFAIYNTIAITPASSTQYKIGFFTVAAGATS